MGHHPLCAPGLCSQPSKPDSTGLGGLYYQHPACCLYPIQSSVGTHACSGARDGIEPKSGRLEGTNGHFFSFFSVQSLSRVQLFATPGTAARQGSLSFTNSWSLLKLISIESVMSSNHLILCHPLLLPFHCCHCFSICREEMGPDTTILVF